jgi:hypothetical protein
MSSFKDHPLLQPRGNPSPVKQWERENCKLTFPAILVYGGAIAVRLIGFFGLIPMLAGIWRAKGGTQRVLGICMVILMFTDESTEAQVVRALFFFGGFYLTWWLDGQNQKREKDVRDWERED